MSASTTTQPRCPGSDLDRVEVDLGDAIGVFAGEIGQCVKAGGEAFYVGRRPPAHGAKQRRAAGLADHRLGIAVSQRQHAQREIADRLDGDAAGAERDGEPEIRIARDPGKDFDAVGDEFLHQERGVGRTLAEPADAVAQVRKGAEQVVLVLEIDGDDAEFGLVRESRPKPPSARPDIRSVVRPGRPPTAS